MIGYVTVGSNDLEKARNFYDDLMPTIGAGRIMEFGDNFTMYGTGMGDCNAHDPRNIPLLLAGGHSVHLKGGRHIKYEKETPLANLHLTLLDKLGVHLDRVGDSTGRLDDRALAGI